MKAAALWLPNRINQWKQKKEEDAVIAGQKPTKKRPDDDIPPAASGEGGGVPPSGAGNEPPAEQAVSLSLKEALDTGMTHLIEVVNDLPKPSKVGMVALLAVLTVVNFSSLAVGWNKTRQEMAQVHEYNINQIEQKMDSAEASLIYRDDHRAKELLAQAEALIAEMPEDSKEHRQDKRALTLQLQERRETANRAVRLSAPDVVASLNGGQGPLFLHRLAQMKEKVFAVADNGKIFEIDPSGGASQAAASPEKPALFLADERRLLSATIEGNLLTLSPTGQPSEGLISWGTEPVQPEDAVVWGSRLYVLDATHNRLLKHYAMADGYGTPQFYLKDGTDVSKGVSMAVDGNLYILNSNGQVTKLRLGQRQEFNLGPVEPALTKASRIRTGEDYENLWILDTTERRLLSFDKKTGELQAQYLHDKFGGTDDFLVDESNLEVLTAKGNNILRFNLPE
jgi:hypothetical protein